MKHTCFYPPPDLTSILPEIFLIRQLYRTNTGSFNASLSLKRCNDAQKLLGIDNNFSIILFIDLSFYNFFITFAGFPAAMQSQGISFVTTLPAPIMERAPI